MQKCPPGWGIKWVRWLFLGRYQRCPFRCYMVGHLQWMPACTTSQELFLKPELLSVALPWLSVKSLVLLAQDSFACSCKALASVNSYPWMVPVIWLKFWASFPQFPGWQEGCGRCMVEPLERGQNIPSCSGMQVKEVAGGGIAMTLAFGVQGGYMGDAPIFWRTSGAQERKLGKSFLLSHQGHQKLSGTEVTE